MPNGKIKTGQRYVRDVFKATVVPQAITADAKWYGGMSSDTPIEILSESQELILLFPGKKGNKGHFMKGSFTLVRGKNAHHLGPSVIQGWIESKYVEETTA